MNQYPIQSPPKGQLHRHKKRPQKQWKPWRKRDSLASAATTTSAASVRASYSGEVDATGEHRTDDIHNSADKAVHVEGGKAHPRRSWGYTSYPRQYPSYPLPSHQISAGENGVASTQQGGKGVKGPRRYAGHNTRWPPYHAPAGLPLLYEQGHPPMPFLDNGDGARFRGRAAPFAPLPLLGQPPHHAATLIHPHGVYGPLPHQIEMYNPTGSVSAPFKADWRGVPFEDQSGPSVAPQDATVIGSGQDVAESDGMRFPKPPVSDEATPCVSEVNDGGNWANRHHQASLQPSLGCSTIPMIDPVPLRPPTPTATQDSLSSPPEALASQPNSAPERRQAAGWSQPSHLSSRGAPPPYANGAFNAFSHRPVADSAQFEHEEGNPLPPPAVYHTARQFQTIPYQDGMHAGDGGCAYVGMEEPPLLGSPRSPHAGQRRCYPPTPRGDMMSIMPVPHPRYGPAHLPYSYLRPQFNPNTLQRPHRGIAHDIRSTMYPPRPAPYGAAAHPLFSPGEGHAFGPPHPAASTTAPSLPMPVSVPLVDMQCVTIPPCHDVSETPPPSIPQASSAQIEPTEFAKPSSVSVTDSPVSADIVSPDSLPCVPRGELTSPAVSMPASLPRLGVSEDGEATLSGSWPPVVPSSAATFTFVPWCHQEMDPNFSPAPSACGNLWDNPYVTAPASLLSAAAAAGAVYLKAHTEPNPCAISPDLRLTLDRMRLVDEEELMAAQIGVRYED